MTIWLPRWPVQRRLLEDPSLRTVPVFVCQRRPRGVMGVVSWAWAVQPQSAPMAGQAGAGQAGAGHLGAVSTASGSITAGMSLAEAMSMLAMAHGSRACHRAWIDHDDPVADRLTLDELARWCRRFSPAVAVETANRPECLHVDVTGTAGFFGGEERLARTAVWTFAARGIHARAAIADTVGAAWAAAHHTDTLAEQSGLRGRSRAQPRRRRWATIPPGGAMSDSRIVPDARELLGDLPITALRLDADVVLKLGEVGIGSIGGVLRLPRKSLASRFGPQLVRRVAEFTGERAEPLEPPRGAELPQANHTFDFPFSLRDATEDALREIVRQLLASCVPTLAAAGRGVTALQLRLERNAAGGSCEDRTPTVVDVGLYRPTASIPHLEELIRLRMSRTPLPAEIDGVTLEVVAAGNAISRQRLLFGEATETSGPEVGMLLDRLSGRLGRAAVFEPKLLADAQPEYAWVAVPPTGALAAAGTAGARPLSPGSASLGLSAPQRRPLWLLPRPLRLEVGHGGRRRNGREGEQEEQRTERGARCAPHHVPGPPAWFRWESRTRSVVRSQGPERIETAWWRGPCVRRDYFIVETDSAERFWLFRQLRDGAWFLHGLFA
ncbi:MAG: DNA polymerase Y family protein [Planctomycetota bacterium]|nr:MAG: DNA polymerase Y family protein [Planctomycetota bacterium]